MNADGTLDDSFHFSSLLHFARVLNVFVIGGGKIVVAGEKTLEEMSPLYMARIESDGSPDLSFHGTGEVAIEGSMSSPRQTIRDLDGNFLFFGGNGDWSIGRVTSEGKLDLTFNDTGKFTLANERGSLFGGAVLPDGKILASGMFYGSSSAPWINGLVRLIP